jgi:aryl-alcohol dehydrogenase-like predicted oxidoreductase
VLDLGINLIDSAEGYGAAFRGNRLRGVEGRSEKAVIATKSSSANLGKAEVIAACERSLLRLQTDYIDLYQLHWPNPGVPFEEMIEALSRLSRTVRCEA